MKDRTLHPRTYRSGTCRRCGLSSGLRCPPGFWMTREESATWNVLSDHDRIVYERKLCTTSASREGDLLDTEKQ